MTRAALFCLLLVPALRADETPDPKAEPALKGKWKVTAARFDGADNKALVGRVLAFGEKEFTAFDGDKKGRTLAFKLDPSADPKRIDITPPGADTAAAGVYVLDGDTLTLCYAEPGAARPMRPESKAGGKTFLLVLERVKP